MLWYNHVRSFLTDGGKRVCVRCWEVNAQGDVCVCVFTSATAERSLNVMLLQTILQHIMCLCALLRACHWIKQVSHHTGVFWTGHPDDDDSGLLPRSLSYIWHQHSEWFPSVYAEVMHFFNMVSSCKVQCLYAVCFGVGLTDLRSVNNSLQLSAPCCNFRLWHQTKIHLFLRLILPLKSSCMSINTHTHTGQRGGATASLQVKV